jgi:hypothetical protein
MLRLLVCIVLASTLLGASAFRVISNSTGTSDIMDSTGVARRTVQRIWQLECTQADWGVTQAPFRVVSATGSVYTLTFTCGPLARTYTSLVAGYVPKVGGVRQYRQCIERTVTGSKPEDPSGILKSQGITPHAFAVATGNTPALLGAPSKRFTWKHGVAPLAALQTMERHVSLHRNYALHVIQRHRAFRMSVSLMGLNQDGSYTAPPMGQAIGEPSVDTVNDPLDGNELDTDIDRLKKYADALRTAQNNVTNAFNRADSDLLNISATLGDVLTRIGIINQQLADQTASVAKAEGVIAARENKLADDVKRQVDFLGNQTNQLALDLSWALGNMSAGEQYLIGRIANTTNATTDVVNQVIDVVNARAVNIQLEKSRILARTAAVAGVIAAAVNGDQILDALTTIILNDPAFANTVSAQTAVEDELMPFVYDTGTYPNLTAYQYVDVDGVHHPAGVAMYTVMTNIVRFVSPDGVAHLDYLNFRCSVTYIREPSSATGDMTEILQHMSGESCDPREILTSTTCVCWFEVQRSTCTLKPTGLAENINAYLANTTIDVIDPAKCTAAPTTYKREDLFTNTQLIAYFNNTCSVGIYSGTTYVVYDAVSPPGITVGVNTFAPVGCSVSLDTLFTPQGQPTFVYAVMQNGIGHLALARSSIRQLTGRIVGVLPRGLTFEESSFGYVNNSQNVPARCVTASWAMVSRSPDNWLPVRLNTLQSEGATLSILRTDLSPLPGQPASYQLPSVSDVSPSTQGVIPKSSFVTIGEFDSRAAEIIDAPFDRVSISTSAAARRAHLTYAMVPAKEPRNALGWTGAWNDTFNANEYVPVDFGTAEDTDLGFVVPLYEGTGTCAYQTNDGLKRSAVTRARDYNSPCSYLDSATATMSEAITADPDAPRLLSLVSTRPDSKYTVTITTEEGFVEDVFSSVCPTYFVTFHGTSLARVTLTNTLSQPNVVYVELTGCKASSYTITLPAGKGATYSFDEGPCIPATGVSASTIATVYVDSVNAEGQIEQKVCPSPIDITVDRDAAIANDEADGTYVRTVTSVAYSVTNQLAADMEQLVAQRSMELVRLIYLQHLATGTLYNDTAEGLLRIAKDAANIANSTRTSQEGFDRVFDVDSGNLTEYLAEEKVAFDNASAAITANIDAASVLLGGIEGRIADARNWLDVARDLGAKADNISAAYTAAQAVFYNNGEAMMEQLTAYVQSIGEQADAIVQNKAYATLAGPIVAHLAQLIEVKDCNEATDDAIFSASVNDGIHDICEWIHNAIRIHTEGYYLSEFEFIALWTLAGIGILSIAIWLRWAFVEYVKSKAARM